MSGTESGPWVVFSLKSQSYAVSAQDVQELLIASTHACVPCAPGWARGVINLRGTVVPLIDLRKRIGMQSALEELDDFCRLMQQREQDHRSWLAELEASVLENREFRLTTDPHQCKFGKWYDSYQPASLLITEVLKKFDAPHRAIHAVADRVRLHIAEGNTPMALQEIDRARESTLSRMIELFAELRRTSRETHREIILVLSAGSRRSAICVDSVDSVELLAAGSIESLPIVSDSSQSNDFLKRIGRRSKSGKQVLILETHPFLAASRAAA